MRPRKPRRLRIIYVLLFVLTLITVGPLYFFGSKMLDTNRERLETRENELQTLTSQLIAQMISQYMDNVNQQVQEFYYSVTPIVIGLEPAEYASDPKLRSVIESFVVERSNILYATVLNNEARGVQAGNFNAIADTFLRKTLEAAFVAARQGQEYQSNPITIYRSGANEPVMVMGTPIRVKNRFLGMVAEVVSMGPIVAQLQDTSRRSGLEAFVVDNAGRLVASYNPDKNVAGMDMVWVPIVQKFLAWRGQARVAETSQFVISQNGRTTPMLGTYSPIQKLEWGVIVQRKLSDAYYAVNQMRNETLRWGLLMVVLSLVVGYLGAKKITHPLDLLTRTARSIAQGDFTQRADIRSRTEIGDLAQTFNRMAEDIQQHVTNLQETSQQNRQLFIDAIQMIATAVDAKDPYTKDHSRRVSAFSVILAKELGLSDEDIEKLRISATLHDVGKIGIEDRVLKKQGILTEDEFETMKRHTVMGYEIVRQVKQLAEVLPGIRWHHESLNGKGYPDKLKGDELPLMVRIIAVADTFDAITTDRPYQAGSDFPKALEILGRQAGSKYDPIVVDALHSAYAKGELNEFEVHRRPVTTSVNGSP
jgi:putative nucleotidyltransferase with HDIG domain